MKLKMKYEVQQTLSCCRLLFLGPVLGWQMRRHCCHCWTLAQAGQRIADRTACPI